MRIQRGPVPISQSTDGQWTYRHEAPLVNILNSVYFLPPIFEYTPRFLQKLINAPSGLAGGQPFCRLVYLASRLPGHRHLIFGFHSALVHESLYGT